MKQLWTLLLILASASGMVFGGSSSFETYFTDGVLRYDYYHGISDKEDMIIPDAVIFESYYAGSKTRMINDMNLGHYRYQVFDSLSRQLIFSESFSNMFQEWQSTDEAKTGVKKVFHESVRFPFPKQTVLLVIEARTKKGDFAALHRVYINPRSHRIIREVPRQDVRTGDLLISGEPDKCIDIVFVAEGYTAEQQDKFIADARKLITLFQTSKPFGAYMMKFNFRYAAVISQESGTDEPDKGMFRRTALNTHFNTFEIARYLTATDNKAMRDAAGAVYYDHPVIVANSSRYGGAGFYNSYSIFSADMDYLKHVFVHEFGHQFGALADEYEGGFTEDYYDLSVEPWEPNITTAKERKKIKWGEYILAETPVPTPNDEKFINTVGLFEGGGYMSKGIYRSGLHCMMRSFKVDTFCVACNEHLKKVIRFYTE